MKILSLLFLSLALAFSAAAKKKDPSGFHFLLSGNVLELDVFSGDTKTAANVQIVVYQDKDIFVAFYTNAMGEYNFLLPVGHEYEIWFGGSAFINKKVYIDARKAPKTKEPAEMPLDMGLFRPVEGQDFPILNEPYVRILWDTEYKQFVPDFEYTDAREKELEKQFKKIKKSGRKSS